MSRMSDLRAQFHENGVARLPLPDDKDLPHKERQAGRQRLRAALKAAAFRDHHRIVLKTTDTEVTATIIEPEPFT